MNGMVKFPRDSMRIQILNFSYVYNFKYNASMRAYKGDGSVLEEKVLILNTLLMKIISFKILII